jgi:hydrogenase/urease accessory protein HupE
LSAAILLVMLAIGISSSNPIAGLARSLLDASLCMIGFAVLGGYLGIRSTS